MRNFIFTGCRFIGTSRVDDLLPAFEVNAIDQLTVTGCVIGGADLSASGGTDRGITITGALGETHIASSTVEAFEITHPTTPVAGSANKKARIHGNVLTGSGSAVNYAGIKTSAPFTKPATATDWYNVTPYDVEVMIGGSSITQIQMDGTTLPFLAGSILLEPGHYYRIVYTDGSNAAVVYSVRQ